MEPIYPGFKTLDKSLQEETLALINTVNERHIHCDDRAIWPRVHSLITELFTNYRIVKQQKTLLAAKTVDAATPTINQQPAQAPGTRLVSSMILLSQTSYDHMLNSTKDMLDEIFHDPGFTKQIAEALQQHILTPLSCNGELVSLLSNWIKLNAMFLPLGTELIGPFKEDMAGTSAYAKYTMAFNKILVIPEAQSQKTIRQMEAFLSDVAQANSRSYKPAPYTADRPTAVMLGIKDGAGGHTAPTHAMATRLKERGWRVETINYDVDLMADTDPYELLGVTFEDGTPMTRALFQTRWVMQKHNRAVARIVRFYVTARMLLAPNLFQDDAGDFLLKKKIIPLNPQLLITTLAYHWSWKALAYRYTGAKTLLVASDVFLEAVNLNTWYRQQSFDPRLRQVHFATMTSDVELLTSYAMHRDQYQIKKNPNQPFESLIPLYKGLQIDSQFSVIGAPIHPAFDAITDLLEIKRLRQKWGVPDGAMSICISRGRLGYDEDLIPALEGYRTTEKLETMVYLQVVCGVNDPFYKKLQGGSYAGLGPNITVIPHPLLAPKDFAELRAISTLDDIKAGGGSTFEGWYMISKGTRSMLLLTPGLTLWWERSNCDAMEKWGIGRTITEKTHKIAIVKQIIQNGLPPIFQNFIDWKPPFDKTVDCLLPRKESS